MPLQLTAPRVIDRRDPASRPLPVQQAAVPPRPDPGGRVRDVFRPSRHPVGTFGLLLLLALALRIPSFMRPFWSPDEGYLATEASVLRHGGGLYTAVVDRKPPLVPWVYELCFTLAGAHGLWLVRLLATACVALTGTYVAWLARAQLGRWATLPAGVLTVAGTVALLPQDAMAATFEAFMLPATAAAVYYGHRRRFLAAGVALAVALLAKQVGLAPLLPLAVQMVRSGERVRHGMSLLAGLFVPVASCALLLGVNAFTFWVFLSSGQYATSPAGPVELCAHAALDVLLICSPFLVFLPLLPAMRGDRNKLSLGLWLLASACGACTGMHFYGHYFLQLVPPLALLATRALAAAHRAPGLLSARARTVIARTDRTRLTAVTVGCALAISALFSGVALATQPPQMRKSLAVASAVDAVSTPRESVFLWGMHPEVYWLSNRPASSRFLTAGFLTNFAGGGATDRVGARYAVPGAWPTFEHELATRPPCVIVDDSGGTPYALHRFPTFDRFVQGGYRPVRDVAGARLYRRRTC